MNTEPKRVLAIHDLSSYGRCALTVVIPTLSALGVQTVPLPTALMSTHTGGFDDIYIRDLTPDMRGMCRHWQSLGVSFDSIYTGFILTPGQGEIIGEIIDTFAPMSDENRPTVLVDPVMGDDGELYSTCTHDMIDVMRRLCEKADVITPNLTEACMLTDTAYPEGTFGSREEAVGFVSRVVGSGMLRCPRIAVTGIEYTEQGQRRVITACFDGDMPVFFDQVKVGASYPGTGELFASVTLGLMLDGVSFLSAAEQAAHFVSRTISDSEQSVIEHRRGTALEPALMRLSHDMYEKMNK